MDTRVQEMARQIEMMRNLVDKGQRDEGINRFGGEQIKLTKLSESDYVEAYLTTFRECTQKGPRDTAGQPSMGQRGGDRKNTNKDGPPCYSCQQRGHFANQCPSKPALLGSAVPAQKGMVS